MPLPKRACRGFRCPATVDSRDGYCDACRPQNWRNKDRFRGSSRDRGYDRDWEKLRALKAKLNPLCEDCEDEGRITPVDEVDHVIPIGDAPERRLDLTNLRSLCLSHHRQKTARDHGRKHQP